MPENVIPSKDMKILEQSGIRNALGAGKDLLRRGYWGIALAGVSSPLGSLTGSHRGEMETVSRRAKEDIAHRAGLRSNARAVRNAIKDAEDPKRKKRIKNRIISGAVAAAGATGLSLSVPALFHDTAAAVTSYKSAYHTETALADHLPWDGRIIVQNQLLQAAPSVDSRWNDSGGNQQLSLVATEESEILTPGYWTAIKKAQHTIALGNAASNDATAMLFATEGSALVTTGSGLIVVVSVAVARKRRR